MGELRSFGVGGKYLEVRGYHSRFAIFCSLRQVLPLGIVLGAGGYSVLGVNALIA